MKTIFLLRHRLAYSSDVKVIRAYESEESAKADAEAFKPVAQSGSLEVVSIDFLPAAGIRTRDIDPTPKATLP